MVFGVPGAFAPQAERGWVATYHPAQQVVSVRGTGDFIGPQ